MAFSKALLWLYVLNLGVALGAGLYESQIVAPQWLKGSEETGYLWDRTAAIDANVGLRFWVYVSTGPLTLLTLASAVALFWVPPPVRTWWLVAVAFGLFERGMTFGYFIPTMIRLMSDGAFSETEAVSKAVQWVRLGVLRHAANALGLLAAMKTFAELYMHVGK